MHIVSGTTVVACVCVSVRAPPNIYCSACSIYDVTLAILYAWIFVFNIILTFTSVILVVQNSRIFTIVEKLLVKCLITFCLLNGEIFPFLAIISFRVCLLTKSTREV